MHEQRAREHAEGTAWIVTTIGSVLAARSPATGRKDAPRWLDLLAKVGPYVFVVGLLVAVAALLFSRRAPTSAGPRKASISARSMR
ncbi:MAG: hypothetical protein EPO20_30360 [Betaproteobacteria bacterium]|nr:MAG: hypothetical protein EPO20_30360 [Betaproteobacteria bacterium]